MGICISSRPNEQSIPSFLKDVERCILNDRTSEVRVISDEKNRENTHADGEVIYSHVECLREKHCSRHHVCIYQDNMEKKLVMCRRSLSTMVISDELQTFRILKDRPHPNILPLERCCYDMRSQSCLLFFPYINGCDLFDHCVKRGGQIEEQELKGFIRQVVSGLLHLKQVCNVAHMDISPENIMVCEDETSCVLIDLEFCTNFPDCRVWGKFEYMAPEMLNHCNFCPFSSDVWSLGATIFNLLHGYYLVKPNEDEWTIVLLKNNRTLDQVLQQTGRTSQLTQYASLSPEIKDLLDKIIVYKPSERLTLEQVADHPWLST